MSLWIQGDAVELRDNATEEDLQVVIRQVYRQVLGNHHVMENQRLTSAESMLRDGDITVRGFVRAVATSDLYRALFFDSSSSYRFIELNFKHLLGRAPQDQAEISEHVQIYSARGYEAEIDSYLDSREYLEAFGENTVPYAKGARSQVGIKNVAFNRMFALERGNATSDDSRSARLIGELGGNRGTKIKAPASASGAYSNTGKRFRVVASRANYGPRVTNSNYSVQVGYAQLSKRLQAMQRSGAKIVSISEV